MADTAASPDTAASREAAGAADAAGVTVRQLARGAECVSGSVLLARVWGTEPSCPPLAPDLLVSLLDAGACVLGAFAGQEIVGMAVGVAGGPCSDEVYSLIAAVAAPAAGRGVGMALKLGQRAWSLERGAATMVWTFDPLVRRNAHFNINRLGAHVREFIPNFYPPMDDAINRADLTDRLVAVWDLAASAREPAPESPGVEVLSPGSALAPVAQEAGVARRVLARIPGDIEEMRRTDPGTARDWRLALRATFQTLLSRGYRVAGFTRSGCYVLELGGDADG